MILSKNEILAEIRKGSLKIKPFKKENVGSCSVDLTLGNEFVMLKKERNSIIVNESVSKINKKEKLILKEKETITLEPGQLFLGITEETITVPNYLCGWIEGRSEKNFICQNPQFDVSYIESKVKKSPNNDYLWDI